MTAYTVSSNEVILYDMYPGVASVNIPKADHDGNAFTNSDHHNVVKAVFDTGYKVQVYEKSLAGWSTFVYLQYNLGASGVAAAAGHLAVYETGNSWFGVTNEGDATFVNVPPAVILSTMTDAYYGFFWCGGVCPQSWVTALATSNFNTDDSVVIGPVGLVDASDPDVVGLTAAASAVNACGWSMADDA